MLGRGARAGRGRAESGSEGREGGKIRWMHGDLLRLANVDANCARAPRGRQPAVAATTHAVRGGATVSGHRQAPPTVIETLFVDAALIVAVKPAGLLAVPGRGEDKADCLAGRVQAAWPDALVVHRLDMATSGLMLFARGLPAQRALGTAFAQREVDKRYVAIVHGLVDAAGGRIDAALAADWPNRPRQVVDCARGRPSLTLWRRLAVDEPHATTRLEIQPLSGRTHQLRVHLASIGHAIVGDTLYATPPVTAPRLMLHACRLSFRHPLNGQPLGFESPAPF